MAEFDHLIGTTSEPIEWWQMVVRAVLVFFYLLVLIRLGERRTFGQISAFDIVIAMVLGSTLSRTLTGNAPLLPTFAATAALILLHVLLAKLSFRSPRLAYLVKGNELLLIREGNLQHDAMRRAAVTEHDLCEALRSGSSFADLSAVQEARLERNGKISFIFK